MTKTSYWYALDSAKVAEKLITSAQLGLTTAEVSHRQLEYGLNLIPEPKGKSLFTIFISQFLNPLIYVLLAVALISFLAGEFQDGFFISAILLINAGLGTFQEWRAENSAAAIMKMVKVKARVNRDGSLHSIDSEQLVPGDCVWLESGMKVPADLRLVEVNHLKVEESLLTGESHAVSKNSQAIDGVEVSLGDQLNMAFASTTVQSGRAVGLVVATGVQTEIGKIAESLKSGDPEKPPLVKRMESFSKKISWIILVVCLVLGAIGLWRDMPLAELFFFLVAVAVSAIPEGLPVALTVALSIGTHKMAKRNVIVRKLPAVEGLGSCTLIASDKTGTLTLDQQTVKTIWLPERETLHVTGQGYNGEGAITAEDGSVVPVADADLYQFILCANICNEGVLQKVNQKWEFSGDAVDVALRALIYKSKNNVEKFLDGVKLLKLIPYESEKKYSAAFYQSNGKYYYACKGALEVIGPRLKKEFRDQATSNLKALASKGYRVLVVAFTETVENGKEDNLPELQLAGLVGLIDALRPEAKGAIDQCHEAGIAVAMITGDHPITAYVIAKELGITNSEDHLITGHQLTELKKTITEEVWFRSIQHKRVFARVSPLQKMDIVSAMKKAGHFVAVTGDGVNDAPALRMAHIGIAMGAGTDLTKESASIIITDNNFASIVAGVEEGRITYNNLRKIIYMLLSTGLAEILSVALAMIFQMPLPFLAIQLLWLNLVTNGIQDISLAFERSEKDVLKRLPRKPNESIFDKMMVNQIVISGLYTTILCFGAWYYCLHVLNYTENYSRTITLMLMVLIQNFHVLNCRSETISIFRLPIKANYLAVIAIFSAQIVHVSASYIPWLAKALRIETIPWGDWFILVALSSSILLIMEIYKLLVFGRLRKLNPFSRSII